MTGVLIVVGFDNRILVTPEHTHSQDSNGAGEYTPFAKRFLREKTGQNGSDDDRDKVHQHIARGHLQRILEECIVGHITPYSSHRSSLNLVLERNTY